MPQRLSIAVHSTDRFADYRAKRDILEQRLGKHLQVRSELSRALVSFQANKKEPFYRWLKFKEGFSTNLVRYCIDHYGPDPENLCRRILDPFAGSGTTITTAAALGWTATGIELLPIGVAAMRARLTAQEVSISAFEKALNRLMTLPFKDKSCTYSFPHLRITKSAFPENSEVELGIYLNFTDSIKDKKVRHLFRFAALSILEEVSYTRKDGQYLRWDGRSQRKLKSTFDKGIIRPFREAILEKLAIMLEDIKGRTGSNSSPRVAFHASSCLEILPTLPDSSVDMVVTSPPYCNRYDYTRTYALELAFLGYDEGGVKRLRQTLLSATVENKSKRSSLYEQYYTSGSESRFFTADSVFAHQESLSELLRVLNHLRSESLLNNSNIPAMVEHYFFEMCFVIMELSRVLSPGGRIIMVNDNVQYHGEEIPVDLILSDFARSYGLEVERIMVLPRGKGNSSQQMGTHGRRELRKCVYVWYKPDELSRNAS